MTVVAGAARDVAADARGTDTAQTSMLPGLGAAFPARAHLDVSPFVRPGQQSPREARPSADTAPDRLGAGGDGGGTPTPFRSAPSAAFLAQQMVEDRGSEDPDRDGFVPPHEKVAAYVAVQDRGGTSAPGADQLVIGPDRGAYPSVDLAA